MREFIYFIIFRVDDAAWELPQHHDSVFAVVTAASSNILCCLLSRFTNGTEMNDTSATSSAIPQYGLTGPTLHVDAGADFRVYLCNHDIPYPITFKVGCGIEATTDADISSVPGKYLNKVRSSWVFVCVCVCDGWALCVCVMGG
jgi:hypothetical protein